MIFCLWLLSCSIISGRLIWEYREGRSAYIDDNIDAWFVVFWIFASGLLVSTIIAISMYVVGVGSTQIKENRKIVSLRGNDRLSGSFTLGTGRINSRRYYFVMVSNGDGGYQREEIPSSRVAIYESDDEPHVEITTDGVKADLIFPWMAGTFGFDTYYTKIVVPRGTIVQSFDKL